MLNRTAEHCRVKQNERKCPCLPQHGHFPLVDANRTAVPAYVVTGVAVGKRVQGLPYAHIHPIYMNIHIMQPSVHTPPPPPETNRIRTPHRGVPIDNNKWGPYTTCGHRARKEDIMNEQAIFDTAQQTLSQHGLAHVPIKMTNARRYIGKAVAELLPGGGSQPKELRLSRRVMKHLSESEIMDTILHEVAHFIAGVEVGHNDAWREACVAVGANPERTADVGKEVREAISKYRMTCQECGNDHYMNRRPKYDASAYRCGVCDGPVGPLEVLDG